MKDNLAKDLLPDNVLSLKHKDTNVSIDNEVISLADLEKIFFLSKLSNDTAFISSVLDIPIKRINAIVHSCQFQEAINEQLAEYTKHQVAEPKEQLLLRYQDFLKELFITLRVSVGMRIRESIENGKPLNEKQLFIGPIEKLMKLEFALHGLPIDIKGVLYGKSERKSKTDEDLMRSIKTIEQAVISEDKVFDPSSMIVGEVDADEIDVVKNEESETLIKKQDKEDKIKEDENIFE